MSQDSLDVVRQLVAVVARTFYQDEYVVALDYLNRHEIVRTDVLRNHLHVVPREMYKIFGELEKHKLVQKVTRHDEPPPNTTDISFQPRRSKQTYFFLDYRKFVDVVKWRIWRLQHEVNVRLEKEQKNLGYDCQSCNRMYTTMEALSMVDLNTGLFMCEICGAELVDNTASELASKSEKEKGRFGDQIRDILDLLRKADTLTLPPPTPLSEVPVPDVTRDPLTGASVNGRFGADGKKLGMARNTGASSGETVIEFAPDMTVKEAARLRESELEEKLRQNQLPPWHMWSTVSGVQMVTDQKITPEAGLRHERYVEAQSYRHSPWNRRERERARLAIRDVESRLRALAKGNQKEKGGDHDEAKREKYYLEFYQSVAQKVGVELPHDPREGYKNELDQLAKEEEERAEMERKKKEMEEKLEKERKESGASGGPFKYRNRYNKYGRGNYHRSNRKSTAPRLFRFVEGGGGGESTSNKANDSSKEAEVPSDGDGNRNPEESMQLSQETAAVNSEDEPSPDPYAEGIYAMSQSKRRKLGLDDDGLEENSSVTAIPPNGNVTTTVNVDGKPKALDHVTAADQALMTTSEYSKYWKACLQKSF